MKRATLLCFLMICLMMPAFASVCPNPQTSSLLWGKPPPPWKPNPFSNSIQTDDSTTFTEAKITVVGIGRGVLCFYKNDKGYEYSIYWNVAVKKPCQCDNHWRLAPINGYVCSDSIEECVFYTANG